MKVVILAGGFGSRIGEETDIRPKPMIEIGEKPIIWHIMKHYSSFGFNEFIILLGYKGYVIKEFFSNYFLHQNDITIDIQKNAKNRLLLLRDSANYFENTENKIEILEKGVNKDKLLRNSIRFIDLTLNEIDRKEKSEFNRINGMLVSVNLARNRIFILSVVSLILFFRQ